MNTTIPILLFFERPYPYEGRQQIGTYYHIITMAEEYTQEPEPLELTQAPGDDSEENEVSVHPGAQRSEQRRPNRGGATLIFDAEPTKNKCPRAVNIEVVNLR